MMALRELVPSKRRRRPHEESHRASVPSACATVASSPSAAPSSAASRLFTDGLRLVSLFLGAEEWRRTRVWRTCRQWYSATTSMHCLDFLLHRLRSPHLALAGGDTLLQSPLARHFTGLSVRPRSHGPGDGNFLRVSLQRYHWLREVHLQFTGQRAARMPIDVVALLTRLPHLHTVWTTDDRLTLNDLRTLSQASSLRSFRRFRYFEGGSRKWTLDELRAFCGPTHQLHQLTDLGRTHGGHSLMASSHLEPLSCLPSLRLTQATNGLPLPVSCLPYLSRFPELAPTPILLLGGSRPAPTPKAIFAHVHFLAHIESLKIGGLQIGTKKELEACMAAPHLTELTLRDLHCRSRSDVAAMSGLASAPALTSLTLSRCYPMDFSGLCHLVDCTRLTYLNVWSPHLLSSEDVDVLTPPSAYLPHLVTFEYDGGEEDPDFFYYLEDEDEQEEVGELNEIALNDDDDDDTYDRDTTLSHEQSPHGVTRTALQQRSASTHVSGRTRAKVHCPSLLNDLSAPHAPFAFSYVVLIESG